MDLLHCLIFFPTVLKRNDHPLHVSTMGSTADDNSGDNNNAHLLSSLGAVLAVALSGMGSATASVAAAQYAMRSTANVWPSCVPIVVAGVLGLYGLVIAVLLCQKMETSGTELVLSTGHRHLAAGLAVGLSCLASGTAMSSYTRFLLYNDNNDHNRDNDQRPEKQALLQEHQEQPSELLNKVRPMTLKAGMMLAFIEALGLYGLVTALFLIGK